MMKASISTNGASAAIGAPVFLAREFFREHREALENAARLLDGERGTSRVISIADDLRRASALSRSLRQQLVSLHQLLRLDLPDDGNVEGAAYFIDLDPASPEVDELCLLTDQLGGLLEDIDACGAANEHLEVIPEVPRAA